MIRMSEAGHQCDALRARPTSKCLNRAHKRKSVKASWSGFDIRCPPSSKLVKRMSNPKLRDNLMFSSGPSILTFANVYTATGCEC